MMLKKLNCLILAMVTFLCEETNASIAIDSLKFRLRRVVEPLNYDLEIFAPFPSPPAFRGKVLITVKCKENTRQITLYQQGLNIEKDVQIRQLPIVTDPPSIIEVQEDAYNSKTDLYSIKLKKSLEKDTNYEIEIKFSGNFANSSDGLVSLAYRATSSHKTKQLIYPWMDTFGARRIFPCFDELGMKATFTIRIGRPSTMQGFSNASFKVTKPASFPQNWFVDEFEKTVPMEPSAVAIVVAGLYLVPKTFLDSSSNTEIRIFADSSIIQKSVGAIALKIFQFFADCFKIPYAFTKLDLFVLLEFGNRAKSSFGAIYLSESAAKAALDNRDGIGGYEMVSELCHVMSKQWIGYAATMSDISDDHLHTALNLFLQTVCVFQISKSINPNWEVAFMEPNVIYSFFNLLECFTADYYLDRPILLMGTDSTSPFDYGYQKLGKAYHLIRMIYVVLGQDIFEKSITNYLRKFEFASSNANDLWDAFTDTAAEVDPGLLSKYNLNVGDIVGSWKDRKGYPLVTIIRNYKTKQIIISQKPFYAFNEVKPEDEKKECWLIPLSYTTKSKSRLFDMPLTISEWLTCNAPVVMEIDVPQDDWILFDLNVNVIGRINYDESNWDLIQKALVGKSDTIVFDGLNRARLTSDMFALAEVGELSYKIVLDAMKFLSLEVHYEIFKMVLMEFDKLYSRLIGTSVGKSFQKYVRDILDPVFNRDEFKNLAEYETETIVNFKTRIIESSCKFGVRACIQQSWKIIDEWKNHKGDSLALPRIVFDTVHCEAVKYGNQNHWDYMWNFSKKLKGEQKTTVLQALTCSTSESLLKRYLMWSIDKQLVSKNDSCVIFRHLSFNRKGYNIMKKFFMSHYNEIYEFHENDAAFALYWVFLLDATVKAKDLFDLEDFAYSKNVHFISMTSVFYKNHENAKKNVDWFLKNGKTFDKYFSHGFFTLRNPF